MTTSWLTPWAEIRDAGRCGRGVFTTRALSTGEVVAAFGGTVVDLEGFHALAPERQVHSLQIAEHLFLVCPEEADPADLVNHSCQPNCGIAGNVLLVTLSDVPAGGQLTFDYAMCDCDPYDEFECHCGSDACRGKVTGNDWMLPAVQDRYRGWFSTYLQGRIDDLHRSGGTDRL